MAINGGDFGNRAAGSGEVFGIFSIKEGISQAPREKTPPVMPVGDAGRGCRSGIPDRQSVADSCAGETAGIVSVRCR